MKNIEKGTVPNENTGLEDNIVCVKIPIIPHLYKGVFLWKPLPWVFFPSFW